MEYISVQTSRYCGGSPAEAPRAVCDCQGAFVAHYPVMFQLHVRGANSASALYYWELVLQSKIASHFYSRLANFARTELTPERFKPLPDRSDSPIEIFADCSGFLAASAIIYHLLFSVKNGTSKRRAEALREALGISDLPALSVTVVRNRFEHIDERLDKEFRHNPSGNFILFKCNAGPVPPEARPLKRFDPLTYKISFLDEEIDIRACYADVQTVQSAIEKSGAASAVRRKLLTPSSMAIPE